MLHLSNLQVPSHSYQFSWSPNPEWSSYYAPAAELHQYFVDVAEKHDLLRHISLNHRVIAATWDDEQGIWNLKNKKGSGDCFVDFDDWCHVFVSATGILNNWKWPDIKGLDTFGGTLLHSAHWNDSWNEKGQRVAVIGNGSSAIQIVPKIQAESKELKVFIRSPTWITPGFASQHAGPGGTNFKYSEEQKRLFRENRREYLIYRKSVEEEMNVRFKFMLADTPEQKSVRQFAENEMRQKLNHNERLIEVMRPNFAVGCRRPTPGENFLKSLIQENVAVISSPIEEIVPEGLKTSDGKLHQVDALLCATGFDTSFRPIFDIRGKNGVNLAQMWEKTPEAYMSVAAANLPNLFCK